MAQRAEPWYIRPANDSGDSVGIMKLRPMVTTDKSCVLDNWLKSWRKSRYAGVIVNNLYYSTTRATIESLIARGATIEVACDDDKPDRIYGWICREVTPDGIPIIHYLYIKDVYLKYNVNELLMTNVLVPPFYTFKYSQVEDAIERKFSKARGWNPEIARRK